MEDNVKYEKGQQNINLRSFTVFYPEDDLLCSPKFYFQQKNPKAATTNPFKELTILVKFEHIF